MADRITVGNVEVMAFVDLVPPAYAPPLFFPDIPLEDWEPYRAEFLDNGKIQLYFGCFVIRSGDQLILVDTGIGPGPHLTQGNGRGQLLDLLSQQGINPGDITTVIHTHLHGDHVGWNLSLSNGGLVPTFPNARYLVPKLDWDHIRSPSMEAEAAMVRDCVVPLEALGVMDLIEGGHIITTDVLTLSAPGHTPGHIVVSISSSGENAALVGDLVHVPVQVQEPGWCARPDWDKRLSRRNREVVLDRWEQDGTIVGAGHFKPQQRFGRVVKLQGRRYWQGL